MEFQVAEAIELIKTLAETENLTHAQALTAFVAEAGLDIEYASELKAALFEEYTLKEMASDSLTKALYSVFVAGETGAEDIQEVDTKETQEGTKYKVRVKDRSSGSSYVRYATREKIAELRANPNIASVELTDYGTTGEDDRGEKTAEAKGGGKDHDGDGKVESSSKEHAGVVHNAIQKRMGGKPDGQDTRKEEVEVEEGIDFKGAKREDERREKIQKEKDKKSPSSKDYRLAMGKFRPGASREERAEGGRDVMREKGTSPKKNGKKMFEAYLELREAKAKTKEEARKKLEAHQAAMKDGGESPYFGKSKGDKDPWSTHASDAKAHSKEDKLKEEHISEADLVDAGRENSAQRSRKKLDGKDVDNSRNIVLMPHVNESIKTEHEAPKSAERIAATGVNEALRTKIKDMAEACCDKCGTPECTCESKKEEKPKKKKAKLDEAGMPILEYSRNNATGPTPEMINPGKDPEGEPGVMNPKGKPKRYKKKGEAPGDRRPNDPSGPELPFDKGTVPNGSGV